MISFINKLRIARLIDENIHLYSYVYGGKVRVEKLIQTYSVKKDYPHLSHELRENLGNFVDNLNSHRGALVRLHLLERNGETVSIVTDNSVRKIIGKWKVSNVNNQ